MRAAVLLGGSSLVSIAMILATAKGLAVLLGPRGVGQFALLQSVVDIAVLLAGLGISVSLVRLLADALQRGDDAFVAAIRRGTDALTWFLAISAAVIVLGLREPLATMVFGSPGATGSIAMAAAAVTFSLVAAVRLATLSAYRQVAAIALLRTLAAVVLCFTTLGAVMMVGETGLSTGIFVSTAGVAATATILLRRRTTVRPVESRSPVFGAMRALVRSGTPFAASSIVGTGIQLAIPILVAIQMGAEEAGYYRAATQVSAGYLSFIAAAMLQDYYPRLSASQAEREVLVGLIDQQLVLVMLLTMPLVLIGIAGSSVIVPILYSPAFAPAVGILAWTLVGTLVRLPSWTLSFAILARGRTGVYFVVELAAGLVLLVASLVGMSRMGLDGLGVAVVLSSFVYYPVVWFAVRRDLPLRVTRAQVALLLTTASALLVQTLPAVGLGGLRTPLAATLAAVWIAIDIAAIGSVLRRRRLAAGHAGSV